MTRPDSERVLPVLARSRFSMTARVSVTPEEYHLLTTSDVAECGHLRAFVVRRRCAVCRAQQSDEPGGAA